ncbi:PREDICTED: acid-sensing ion channel 1 isoform X2 [Crocodylus porosus]|uniref:Acid-sensing ion channel 1 n=1 Tax=Crocodylus porosus TaxID=8502 RepID=A0A7M4E7N2_CROPO|nr:PREDICTED: acid-sensing ion channel 1 isoform X2 [Crocodylus porosus]
MFPPLPERVARPQEGWEPGWARRTVEPAGRDRGSLQDVAAFLLEQTKFHGLRYVFSGRLSCPRRAFWALAILASLALLLTWSSNRIRYLLSSPVHTKVHVAYARNLTFPAVTICNNNLLLLRRMGRADLHLAGYWLGLLTQRLRPEPAARELLREERWRWLEKLLDFSHYLPPPPQGHNTLHLLDRLGHQLEEMLLSCRFRGERCGPHDFTTVFTRYGKCYTFNAGQDGKSPLITVKGGTGNGLEIMLDIQQDEYLPIWGETDETSFEAGIKVQIHSQDEPPLIDQLGFGVAPGFQTFVSCQEQRLIYLPPPWGDCKAITGDSEFFDTYSITACRIDCETRYLVENCNCRMVHMPGDAPYCTPEQYKECADPALDFLVEKDNNYCICEMPCNVTRYGKELSMVKIPSKASAKYLAKKYNKSEQYIGENILVLDIFFEALNYETIEQKKAYEVAGLLGDIGGQMGLFIGASILTVLELVDYVYEVIKHKLCRRGKCRKNHRRNNADQGVALSMDDVKRHNPCESIRGHPAGMTYAANILPHHSARGTFEDFTC